MINKKEVATEQLKNFSNIANTLKEGILEQEAIINSALENISNLKEKLDLLSEAIIELEKELNNEITAANELPDPTDFTYKSFKGNTIKPVDSLNGGIFELITKKKDPKTPSVELVTENKRKSAAYRHNRNRLDAKVAQLVCSEFASVLREFYRDYIKIEILNNVSVSDSEVEKRISKELDLFLTEYNKVYGTLFTFTTERTNGTNIHRPNRKNGYWEKKFLEAVIL